MNITNEHEVFSDDEIKNLKINARKLVEDKNVIQLRFNELAKTLQKVGYSVNPKTGEVKELKK